MRTLLSGADEGGLKEDEAEADAGGVLAEVADPVADAGDAPNQGEENDDEGNHSLLLRFSNPWSASVALEIEGEMAPRE